MNFKWLGALCAVCVCFQSLAAGMPQIKASIPTGKLNEIIPGQLLVKIKPGATSKSIQHLPVGAQMLNKVGPLGWTLWSIPTSVDPRKAAAALKSDSSVLFA